MTTASYSPSWEQYKQNYLRPLLFGGVTSLIAVGISGYFVQGIWVPIVIVVLVALAIGYLALYFHVSRVQVTDDTIRVRNAFGVQRTWPLTVATTAVITENLIEPSTSAQSRASGRNLFVFRHDGRRLFRLSGGAWAVSDLQAIATALPKAHVKELDQLLSMQELSKLYKHAVPWPSVHPYVFALVVALATVAVLFGAIIVAIAVMHPGEAIF